MDYYIIAGISFPIANVAEHFIGALRNAHCPLNLCANPMEGQVSTTAPLCFEKSLLIGQSNFVVVQLNSIALFKTISSILNNMQLTNTEKKNVKSEGYSQISLSLTVS